MSNFHYNKERCFGKFVFYPLENKVNVRIIVTIYLRFAICALYRDHRLLIMSLKSHLHPPSIMLNFKYEQGQQNEGNREYSPPKKTLKFQLTPCCSKFKLGRGDNFFVIIHAYNSYGRH